MLPALIGFALGWLVRGLWDRRGATDDGWESYTPPSPGESAGGS